LGLNSLFAAWTRRLGSGASSAAIPAIPAGVSVTEVEPLPIPAVDFEVHYDVWDTPFHAPMRAFARHSGGRYRVDRDIIGGMISTTAFAREGGQGATIFMEAGAKRAAFQVADPTRDPVFASWRERSGTRTGETEMIGERCVVWTHAGDVPPAMRTEVCLTADGIPLRAALVRTPRIPLMRALHLQRRRQDPALFTVPAGIAVQDVPDLVALGDEIMRHRLVSF
jgi:hypothetical protein